MNKTQLANIDIKDLHKADWNYKTDGTDEQIEKLINSINQDKSVGVLAVRETEDGFEVIDGNHRLEAVSRMKWEEVPCENFGLITKATAITIARRRNHQWFEDDLLSYSDIFKNDVLQEYSLDDLEKFMPDTKAEMMSIAELTDFDWDQFERNDDLDDDPLKTIKLIVNDDIYQLWKDWLAKCQDMLGYDNPSSCFELAIIEALNTPIESVS
jgi:hypothetical protein